MLRFVVLEHIWNGVHWDFMLEYGDALGNLGSDRPAPDCRGPRPARPAHPGNHRRIFLDYEGEISGNRGHVRRVDAGTYRPLVWTAGRVRVELVGSQLVGEVELCESGSESGATALWIFRMGNFD